jgi:hypothetical protein
MNDQFRPVDLVALGELLLNIGSPHAFMVQDLTLDGKPVERVHHYTDLAALAGIVTADDLWLTGSTYSNDTDELVHGFEAAERVLVEDASNASNQDREFLDAVRDGLRAQRERAVFVACFCMTGDLLSQWREYGARGTGVAIGFDPGGFQQISGPDAPQELPTDVGLMYLWRVFYEPSKQEQIVRDCLSFLNAQRELDFQEKVDRAVDALRFFAPTFKDERFSEEKEARLVFSPNPQCPVKPRYRIARGMLVPYYSLQQIARAAKRILSGLPALPHPGEPEQSWKLPLTAVQVGPGPNRSLNEQSVRSLLSDHGYAEASVTASTTPYRA